MAKSVSGLNYKTKKERKKSVTFMCVSSIGRKKLDLLRDMSPIRGGGRRAPTHNKNFIFRQNIQHA